MTVAKSKEMDHTFSGIFRWIASKGYGFDIHLDPLAADKYRNLDIVVFDPQGCKKSSVNLIVNEDRFDETLNGELYDCAERLEISMDPDLVCYRSGNGSRDLLYIKKEEI